MHLGLLLECEYRPRAPMEAAFQEAFALTAASEAGGLDGVWLAERHFAAAERLGDTAGGGVPSFASAPLIVATAIAARTSRLRVGIAVSVLPLSHPVRLAEEVATLDHVSQGRLDFGVGRSGFASAYAGYGVPYEESRSRFSECLDILLAAWTQESFSYAGEHYAYDDVCVMPKPYQKPHPPIRIAATSGDTSSTVGRMGYPIFVGLRSTDVSQTAAHLAAYREAWREAGHAGSGDAYLRIPVYVAPTAAEAYEGPKTSTLYSYSRLAESYAKAAQAAGGGSAQAAAAASLESAGYDELLENRLAYGTPDAVAARLIRLCEDLNLSGLVIEPNVGGGTPWELVFRSVELFTHEVAPALHRAAPSK